ncbi:hypothetical protein HXX76_011773 [Chlamydomonas incerta]|nr:hypothetical protein HXX76_011773 [Chlamydomonas incerta]|eukprot:KAG2426548.1 hypothetical protein HXX76_011773 [Chlamydomonas incerta]
MTGSTAQALLECHYSVHGAFLRGGSSSTGGKGASGGSSSSSGSSRRSSLSSAGGSMDDLSGVLPRSRRPRAREQPPPTAPSPTLAAPPPARPLPPAAAANATAAASAPGNWPPLLQSVGGGGLAGIPAVAVHGQLDFVCPATTAFELCRAWPGLRLRLVPGAGHSMYDPAITHELVEATRLLYDAAAARYFGAAAAGSTTGAAAP